MPTRPVAHYLEDLSLVGLYSLGILRFHGKLKSRRQFLVLQLKQKYRAMATICKELRWIKSLLHEMGIDHRDPITLHCDNKAALHISSNPVFHERTKHIELDSHLV